MALGVYNLTPDVFWSMTPPEFESIGVGRRMLRPNYGAGLSRTAYEEMKEAFPDG